MTRHRLKIPLQIGLIALVTWGVLEAASFFLFPVLTGGPFDPARLTAERAERMGQIAARMESDVLKKTTFIPHPYLGYVGRPGARLWEPDYPPFNAFGVESVAGRPYPSRTGDDRFVIGVLGGSVAAIFANSGADHLAAALKSRCRFFENKDVVVVNLATGGFKQPQQVNQLIYTLLCGFQFDAVINIDGFNDMALAQENMERGIFLLYPSAPHHAFLRKTLEDDFSPENVRLLATVYRLLETEGRVLGLLQKWPFRISPALNMAGERWSGYTRRKVDSLEQDLVWGAVEEIPDELRGPEVSLAGNRFEQAAAVWEAASELLHAICRRYQVAYFHFLQPNQYVPGSKRLSAEEKAVAFDPEHPWSVSAREGYPYLIRAGARLARNGVPFFDLTDTFRSVDEPVYTDTCCHFDDLGNKLLAQRIARAMVAHLNACGGAEPPRNG